MAFTQADLDAIDLALKSGTNRVRFQDREVEYRSVDELLKVRGIIFAEVNGTTTTRQIRVWTEKGI